MGVEISRQTAQLCFSALLGTSFCFIYDTLRLIRGRVRLKAVTAVLDLLFWIIVAVGSVWFSMTVLGGEFRLFALFGIICGGVIWYLVLSKLYLKVGFTLIDSVLWLFRQILRPFAFVVRSTVKFYRSAKKKIKNYFKLRRKHSMMKRRTVNKTHSSFLKARRGKYREVEKDRTVVQDNSNVRSRVRGD
jgi:spore cortex biosynthesis protein YabQ